MAIVNLVGTAHMGAKKCERCRNFMGKEDAICPIIMTLVNKEDSHPECFEPKPV